MLAEGIGQGVRGGEASLVGEAAEVFAFPGAGDDDVDGLAAVAGVKVIRPKAEAIVGVLRPFAAFSSS